MSKYLKRKLSFGFPWILTLWVLFLIGSILTVMILFVAFLTTAKQEVYFDSPHCRFTSAHLPYISICVELLLIILWRKSTFRRQEMVLILKDEGFAMRKRSPLFNLLTTWFRALPEGRKDEIYVKSEIWGAFNLPAIFGERAITPELVYTRDWVAFTSLISGPFNILEEIKIDKTTRIIPKTNVPEIDTILEESLKDVADFRAYIVFNSECLMLAVVGSSWLGRKFGERILKSAEIIEKLNNELKVKYPATKSWEEYELKFNYDNAPTQFDIVRKEVKL